MFATSDFRKGLKIEFKGEPCEIIDFQHVKMGRGGANVKTKMRNIKTGSVVEETIRSGEKFPPAGLEERKMQYLYFVALTSYSHGRNQGFDSGFHEGRNYDPS